MTMPFAISICYSLLALAYILLSYQGEFALNFAVKIMPLLLLLAWIIHSSAKLPRGLILALLCCMTGDVLLAWNAQTLFVYGLAAFLFGHIGYLLLLRPFVSFNALLLIPYTLFAAVALSLMWPALGEMAIPVLVYIGILVAMSFATWCSRDSNNWLIIGGLVFISSDALLGLNKFYQPIPEADSLIMLTYYLAQYALIRGFMRRQENKTY
ncbi:lysoplasmalogenase [Rheinheimera baltica]|uniref:lysoplasmalogenase n=1 Tax=Rheinheimera baltica TaxID=67576 RepID=UPI0004869B44|nr:lysoplasmalogenase [Rheinheimera baltica]